MRALALLLALLPSLASAQTTVHAGFYDGSAVHRAPDGLGLWLDDDAATKTTSGGNVTGWDCKVKGTTFAADAGDNAPAESTLGSRATVLFDDANTESLVATVTPTSDYNGTCIVVVQPDASTNHVPFRIDLDASTGRNINAFFSSVPSVSWRANDDSSTAGNADSGLSYSTGTTYILTSTTTDATRTIQVNGANSASESTALTWAAGPDTTTLGKNGRVDNNYWSGHVCEVMFWQRILTSDEIAAVEAYLAARWSVTLP